MTDNVLFMYAIVLLKLQCIKCTCACMQVHCNVSCCDPPQLNSVKSTTGCTRAIAFSLFAEETNLYDT